jgi:hypothetical protein
MTKGRNKRDCHFYGIYQHPPSRLLGFHGLRVILSSTPLVKNSTQAFTQWVCGTGGEGAVRLERWSEFPAVRLSARNCHGVAQSATSAPLILNVCPEVSSSGKREDRGKSIHGQTVGRANVCALQPSGVVFDLTSTMLKRCRGVGGGSDGRSIQN